jgi:hypothetical protein
MPDGAKIINTEDYLKPNPEMVFRKEEEGAFLFDPSTGNLKYLNASGVNIYELCDGRKTVGDIISFLTELYPEIAVDKIVKDTDLFFQSLVSMQFVIKQ